MPLPGELQAVLTPTPVLTGNYAAGPGEYVRTDSTGTSLTVTLPYAPPAGTTVTVEQEATGGNNTTTIAASGSDVFGHPGSGVTSLPAMALAGQVVTVTYRSGVWVTAGGSLPLAGLDTRYAAAGSVVPATTGTPGIVQFDGTAGDMQPLGAAAAGSSGLAADAKHVHPTTGLIVSGATAGGDLTGTYPNPSLAAPVPVNKGGTGSTTKNFVDLTTGQSIGGTKTFTGEVVVPTPVSAGDAVTKAYADAISAGLAVKPSVRLATAAALPANNYSSGVITASGNGALTVDGVAVASSDRVLVKNEATQANNGIYTVTATGSAGAAFVLTRASDMNTGTQVPGAFCFVSAGTVGTNTGWSVTGAGPYTIGTTAIVWTQFSGPGSFTAGTGITISGNAVALTVPVAVANGGTGATTAAGAITNLGAVDTSSAQTVASKTLTGTSETIQALGTIGPGTVNVNVSSGNIATATLGGNVTLTFSGAPGGAATALTLWLTQDLTGSRTVTWPGSVTWLDGQAPTITAAPGSTSVVVLVTLNGGTGWWGIPVTGAPVLDTSASDIAGTGTTAAAGTTGKAADAGHVHTSSVIGSVTISGTPVAGAVPTVSPSDITQGTWTVPAGGVVLDGTAGDIQSLGSQAAGAIGKAADAGHVHPTPGNWTPSGHGLQAWTSDPTLLTGSLNAAAATGQIYLAGLQLGLATSITQLWLIITQAATSVTAAQIGLYSSTGSRLVAADLTTRIATTTTQAVTVSATACGPGMVWLAWFYTGTGNNAKPLAGAANGATVSNLNLTAAASRYGTYTAGQPYSSLPASITPASITQLSTAFWAGIG